MPLTWNYGDRRKLAGLAGISPQYLSDLLHRRKSARLPLAKKLVAAAQGLGYSFTLLDFLDPADSCNPLLGKAK